MPVLRVLAFRALELALGAVWLQGAQDGSEQRRGRGVPQSLALLQGVLASPSSGVAGQPLALLMRACVRSRASSPSWLCQLAPLFSLIAHQQGFPRS